MRLAIIFFTLLLTFSCADEEVNALRKEVLRIHDDVMPKMENIHSISSKLKAKKVNIKDSLLLKEINVSLAKLHLADDAMMTWMHEYKAEYGEDGMPKDSILAYLGREKLKIKDVGDKMLESIKIGEELLKNIK